MPCARQQACHPIKETWGSVEILTIWVSVILVIQTGTEWGSEMTTLIPGWVNAGQGIPMDVTCKIRGAYAPLLFMEETI